MERQAKDGTVYQQVGEDSWSPVTRTAKDGTVYKKVGDDSWSPMQAQAPKPAPPQSNDEIIKANIDKMNDAGDTENDAMFDTLTAGHLPQVKAKIKQLLSGEGIANDEGYVKRRDQEIADMKARAERNPMANAVGKTAGFVAPMLLTGGGSAVAESAAVGLPAIAGAAGEAVAPAIVKQGLMKAVAKGAGTGFAMGAAQNPGDVAGVLDPIQAKARATNGAIGSVVGGTIAGAANKIPDAAKAVSGLAETRAFKAAGAMLKDFRKGYANDSIQDTGRFILDHGLVKAGDTFEDVAEKSTALKEKVGEALGAGYDASAKILPTLGPEATAKVEAAGFNPVRDKAAILASVKKDLGYAFKGKQALQAVSDYLDDLAEQHGDAVLNPKITNQIKTSLDKTAINWERNPLSREPDAEAALKTMRSYLGDKVSSQVQAMGEAIGNPEAAKVLTDLNSKYGMASKVSRMAADKANREAANKAIGLTDTISGGAGAAAGATIAGPVGAVIGGAVGAGGNKLARTYGPAIVADATNAAGKALSKIPDIPLLQQSSPATYKGIVGAIGANLPAKAAVASSVAATSKGPDKWAADGAAKLIEHSPDDKQEIEKAKGAASDDKRIKDLLIKASDLKPGTPAMKKVMADLKARTASVE